MTDKQFENNGCSKCRNNRGKYVQGKYIPEQVNTTTKQVSIGWNGQGYCGFNAFPAGRLNSSGEITYGGTTASFWTSTGNVRYLTTDSNGITHNKYKVDSREGHTVRCIK
jgi:uncharacterized protein (TIGR02145 family)